MPSPMADFMSRDREGSTLIGGYTWWAKGGGGEKFRQKGSRDWGMGTIQSSRVPHMHKNCLEEGEATQCAA